MQLIQLQLNFCELHTCLWNQSNNTPVMISTFDLLLFLCPPDVACVFAGRVCAHGSADTRLHQALRPSGSIMALCSVHSLPCGHPPSWVIHPPAVSTLHLLGFIPATQWVDAFQPACLDAGEFRALETCRNHAFPNSSRGHYTTTCHVWCADRLPTPCNSCANQSFGLLCPRAIMRLQVCFDGLIVTSLVPPPSGLSGSHNGQD